MPPAMATRVSLTELTQAGVRLRPAEAAAIVAEVCAQRRDGRLRGLPSANVIRVTQTGDVVAEGPVNTDGPDVAPAAQLLDDLLPSLDAPPEFRASGSLRLVIARALGTLDLPPFATLDQFAAAIARFAAPDVRTVARELFEAWENAQPADRSAAQNGPPAVVEPLPDPTLTISDVRRARRATGLTIDEVSERSRIPSPLLRELEWGYLKNWPAGLYGRAQLVRYARAAGLDEQLVVEIASPLLDEVVAERGGPIVHVVPAEQSLDALVAAPARLEIPAPAAAPLSMRQSRGVYSTIDASSRAVRRRWRRATAAVAATLALALAPALWEQFHQADDEAEPSAVERPVVSSPASLGRSGPAVSGGISRGTATNAQPRPRAIVPDAALPPVKMAEPAPTVTAQPAAYSPTFSNTGTAVFFHEDAGNNSALGRSEADEGNTVLKITRIVDDNAQNFHARPSPDGAHIAFDSDREGVRAVFVADGDGQHVRRISGDGFAAVPSWAPDGRRLAFVKAEAAEPRVWNIWTTDLESGEMHRVTSYSDGQPWGASWFPDSQRLAFSHDEELVVLNLNTSAQQVFKTPRQGHAVRTPAVSPDGRRVIFQVQRDGAWLLDLRNGSMRRVLEDPTAEEYTWSPDGHRVAFHSPRAGGWGVWIMGQ
jgi:hypothetical protein